MVYVTLAGVRGIPDFAILTWIGFTLCFLIMFFGAFRLMRAEGDPAERQSGIATLLYGAMFVPAVAIFIEIPHMLFF